jgi:hypothetical protein
LIQASDEEVANPSPNVLSRKAQRNSQPSRIRPSANRYSTLTLNLAFDPDSVMIVAC